MESGEKTREKDLKENIKKPEKKQTKNPIKKQTVELDLTLDAPKKKKVKLIQGIEDNSAFLDFLRRRQASRSVSLDEENIRPIQSNFLEEQPEEKPIQSNFNIENKNDSFKYSVGSENSDGPKYISSGQEGPSVARASVENISERRKSNSLETEMRKADRPTYANAGSSHSSNIETYIPVKDFDKNSSEKRDPFHKQEVKYDPSSY